MDVFVNKRRRVAIPKKRSGKNSPVVPSFFMVELVIMLLVTLLGLFVLGISESRAFLLNNVLGTHIEGGALRVGALAFPTIFSLVYFVGSLFRLRAFKNIPMAIGVILGLYLLPHVLVLIF